MFSDGTNNGSEYLMGTVLCALVVVTLNISVAPFYERISRSFVLIAIPDNSDFIYVLSTFFETMAIAVESSLKVTPSVVQSTEVLF